MDRKGTNGRWMSCLAGLLASGASLLLPIDSMAWVSLQEDTPNAPDEGTIKAKPKAGAQPKDVEISGESIQKSKGALRKSVPITPNMKTPPHFNTPPKAAKAEDPTQPGAASPAPPPPPAGPGAPGDASAGTAVGGKTTDLGYGVKEAWELGVDFKKKPKGFKFQLNLEDLDLAELVKHMAKITGKKFVVGNKVKQNIKATIIAPTPVTAEEAFRAFLSVLEINDMTIVPEGAFLKIIDTAGGQASHSVPVISPGEKSPVGDQVVTRIEHLKYVGAQEMAQLLAKYISKGADISAYGSSTLIITDFASNIKKILEIIRELDKTGTGDKIWVEPVHFASATDLAETLQKVLQAAGVSGADKSKGGGAKGAPGPGPVGGTVAGTDQGGSAEHLSEIIPDDRTNSLIIISSEAAYLKIVQLMGQLDVVVPGEGQIHVHSLQHADAEELATTLSNLVQGSGKGGKKEGGGGGGEIFDGEVKVTHDKATNSPVITASMRDFASLMQVVEELDVARRQVFVEAVIMEVQLSKIRNLGVTFNAGTAFDTAGESSLMFGGTTFGSMSSILLDPTSLTGLALGLRGPEISEAEGIFGTGVSIPAFGVLINALQSNNDVNILSTPNILATDNETAEITVGGNVPVQQGYSGMSLGGLAGAAGQAASGALGSLGGLANSFNPMFSIGRQNVGLTLKITPHINESDQVKMEIEIEISEVTGETDLGPLIDQRMAKTVSVVKDQQTVVLGGLVKDNITETVDKIPFLGDIPILGFLFKKKKTRITKTNLLIFITPYIIRDATDFRSIFNRKMEERREFIEQFTAFQSGDYEPIVDYSRTNGLLEEIHKTMLELEAEQEMIQQLMMVKPNEHKPKKSLGNDSSEEKGSGSGQDQEGEGASAGAEQPASSP